MLCIQKGTNKKLKALGETALLTPETPNPIAIDTILTIQGYIGDVQSTIAVDTCAVRSFVSSKHIASSEIRPFHRLQSTIEGKPISTKGVADITFSVKGKPTTFEMIVVENMPVSILLGQNFNNQNIKTIDYQTQTVDFHPWGKVEAHTTKRVFTPPDWAQKEIPEHAKSPAKNSDPETEKWHTGSHLHSAVVACHQTTVQPLHSAAIEVRRKDRCRFSDGQMLYTDPTCAERHGLSITRCLVKGQDTADICVANFSSQPVHIAKHMKVACAPDPSGYVIADEPEELKSGPQAHSISRAQPQGAFMIPDKYSLIGQLGPDLSHLSELHRQQVQRLLIHYDNLFTDKLGFVQNYGELEVEVTDNTPQVTRMYRTSQTERDAITTAEVHRLLGLDVS